MTSPETKKYPTPVYAAAGAGDLAYQQLRKLPAKVAELRERVAASDSEVTERLRSRVDVDKLRAAYRRNAHAAVSGARVAQERAQAIYADLVARGEQVVRSARTGTGETPTVPAPLTAKPTEQIEPAPAEHPEA